MESLDSIDCKIIFQNAKGYYQISIYDANPVLAHLMESSAMSKNHSVSNDLAMNLDSVPVISGISSVSSNKNGNEKAALPDLRGQTLSFMPKKGHAKYIEGSIEVVQTTGKIEYPARTNTVTKVLKDLAEKKKTFKVKVIGANSNGYLVKKL